MRLAWVVARELSAGTGTAREFLLKDPVRLTEEGVSLSTGSSAPWSNGQSDETATN